jgi:large subunit ribosomal protein L35Ae
MSEQPDEPRVYVNGTFTSFRRNKRTINPAHELLKIDGVHLKGEARFHVGKKVAAPEKGKDKTLPPNWGIVTQVHGNSGVVRAKFDRKLPPIFLGTHVQVFLFPSTI